MGFVGKSTPEQAPSWTGPSFYVRSGGDGVPARRDQRRTGLAPIGAQLGVTCGQGATFRRAHTKCAWGTGKSGLF